MKSGRVRTAYAALFLILSVAGLAAAQLANGATEYKQFVQSTSLSVFGDGSTEVNQTLILPANLTSLNLPLFANDVGNLLADNELGSPVSYSISGGNVTLYTFGATRVSLLYDTNALTSKQGTIWDVKFNSPLNVSLTLPSQATILSFSSPPISISTANGSPTLALAAGNWEISYGLPIAIATSTSATTQSGGGTSSMAPQASALTVAAVVGSAAAAVVIFVFLMRTGRLARGGASAVLRFDDVEILRFVKEKGGKAVEAEIRERFSLPRTSAWRQAKRLERLGFIKISKLGTQNEVELLRGDFEQGSSR